LRVHGILPEVYRRAGTDEITVWRASGPLGEPYVIEIEIGDGTYSGWLTACTPEAIDSRLAEQRAL
jgi:hypothetical protein